MVPHGRLDSVTLTGSGDARAEAFVAGLLDEAVRRIQVDSDPVAVLLQGSFARGEGTVRFDEHGEPMLWRDLDLVLVYRTRERTEVLDAIEADLMALPGVRRAGTTVSDANISLAQLPLFIVRRWRDLKTLELAKRSLLLAGRDVREEMAVRDGKIPIESAERFLLQKAIGLCLAHPHIGSDPFVVNYEVSKLYIEISSALALLEGEPSVRFEERIEAMRTSDEPRIRDLADRTEATGAYKVEGDLQALETADDRRLWEQGRNDLFETLALIHGSVHGEPLTFRSVDDVETYYAMLSRRLLPRMLATVMGRRWPPSALQRGLAAGARTAYATYAWLALGARRRILNGEPLAAVYCAALALLVDLEPGGRPNLAAEGGAGRFLDVLGADPAGWDDDRWPDRLEELYFRTAKPLYGVG